VPLADAAIAVLEAMRAIRQSPYVFPGANAGQPVRGGTVWWLANQLAGVSVHGLRSSFRDWASEQTDFPRDVCEQALAHAIPSAAEAAYRRGDLLGKRRKLMQAWAVYCGKPS
jgi:integrase